MSEDLDYSRCPTDGCKEVGTQYKNGGISMGKREEYRDWQIFHADPRQGGCGATWSTATKQGYQARSAKGQYTRGLTRNALLDTVHSLPSDAYRRNWELVDWTK